MSSKKDTCPQCNKNEKGIKAKTCKACQMLNMAASKAAKKAEKPTAKPTNIPGTDIPAPGFNEPDTDLIKPRVGELTPDGKYYL